MIIEDKVSELEEMLKRLAYIQMNSQMNMDRIINEMKEDARKTREDMKKSSEKLDEKLAKNSEDIKKSSEKLDEKLAKINEEMKEDTRKLKDELKEFKEQMKKDREKMNKKWGDLANKWGTILEDMVIPNIEEVAEKHFNLKDCDDLIIRRTKKNSKDMGKSREFDVIAVYGNKILLNETKAAPKQDYMDKYIELIRSNEFFDYFPEYNGYELIPVFSTLYFPDEAIKYLSRNKIYAMGIKEDTMDILNFDDVK